VIRLAVIIIIIIIIIIITTTTTTTTIIIITTTITIIIVIIPIPIIISATGVIPKSLNRSIATLHLDQNIYILLQKTIVINTTTIVRRFLNN
jgi:hypothetical protein